MARRAPWITLAVILLLVAFAGSGAPQGRPAGVVTILEGTATASRSSLPSAVRMNPDDQLFSGDRIATGEVARFEMLLGGKARVAMQERSVVTIGERPGVLSLDRGHMWVTLSAAGETFQVNTPTALVLTRDAARLSVDVTRATDGGVVTHVDVLAGAVSVVTSGEGTLTALQANDGLTIAGAAVGPVRPLRPRLWTPR